MPAVVWVAALWVALGAGSPSALADGWHGAAMSTKSLDDWINRSFSDLKSAIPDLKDKIGAAEISAGRDLEALKNKAKASGGVTDNSGLTKQAGIKGKLTAQQQMLLGRKSADCLEILGCMNPKNIFPAEFPNFPMQQIPKYRDAAKQMLKLMGPTGSSAITAQLRAELMGSSPVRAQGLEPAATYYTDMLEVLREHMANGTLSEQDIDDLMKAASGQKSGPQRALAEEVQKALADLDGISLATILRWAEESNDSKRRTLLYSKVRARLKEATLSDLLAVVDSKADSATKSAAQKALDLRWSEASPLEVLKVLEQVKDPQTRRTALAALAEKTPTYAEVKPDLPELWNLTKSSDSQVAQGAKDQLANAFLRAPIPECLDWLARGNADQDKLIWEQVDDRISRADAPRKAGYREAAMVAIKDSQGPSERRVAALDLLAHLKDRQVVGELIDQLSLMSKEERPKAGKLMRDLTGQNFGPFVGDGTPETISAVNKWREWWKANGGK